MSKRQATPFVDHSETMLPPNLTLGYVHLTVADLDRSVAFYQNALGFKLHRRENGTAYLGAGRSDLLALTEQPGARHYRGRTGLYHFAILTPSRLALAHSLRRLAETRTPLEGFSDHLVSEALYLSDPDDNGIEIYRDRPRPDWYDAQGNFRMGSEPLDMDGILSELEAHPEPWDSLHPDTILGHMHLHVRNIPEAQQFYGEVLGFDLMANWGGTALFISAGGYHHHLGLNTWQGVGAPPPPTDAAGLRYFIIHLPHPTERDQVLERLRRHGTTIEDHPQGHFFRDPSHNGIVLAAP